jgi:hypothetical protein
VGGVAALCVVTAGIAIGLPIVFGCIAGGSFCFSTGISGVSIISSKDTIVNGLNWRKLLISQLISGVCCTLGALASAGIAIPLASVALFPNIDIAGFSGLDKLITALPGDIIYNGFSAIAEALTKLLDKEDVSWRDFLCYVASGMEKKFKMGRNLRNLIEGFSSLAACLSGEELLFADEFKDCALLMTKVVCSLYNVIESGGKDDQGYAVIYENSR